MSASPSESPTSRTAADCSTLLVELGRAMRAFQFYDQRDPGREEILERSFRAWQADLARSGCLELEVRRGCFWIGTSDVPVGRGRLDELAREFSMRALRRLRVDPELDAESFRALAHLLVTDPDAVADGGGIESAYYATERRGVLVNDADPAEQLERARESMPEAGPNDDTAPVLDLPLAPDPEPVPVPPPDPAEELPLRLCALEDCEDDPPYPELADRFMECAVRLARRGPCEALYRSLVTLMQLSGDDAKRSIIQRKTADRALRRVAGIESVRTDLIDRACGPDARASLEATQVLLHLGAEVAAPLLDQLEDEPHPERRGHLSGILIALGEAASPELVAAVERGGPMRKRVAVWLAGESQSPRAVPGLTRLLTEGEPDVRREAAKALVRIGDGSAMQALVQALASPVEGVPALAAFCLGATRRPAAVRPLLLALEGAVDAGELELAAEIVRAVGRLGRSEAASGLAALLRRRSFFGRSPLNELKLVAVEALGRLPGRPALLALQQLVRGRDERLRKAAERALSRHAPQDAN